MPKQKAVIFFDGKCSFCTKIAQLLSRIDFGHHFLMVDLWKNSVLVQNSNINRERLKKELHLIDKNGVIYSGYWAFKQIFSKIPLLMPFSILFYIPGADLIGKRIYSFVASNRYKILPCNGHCQLVTR